VAGCLKWLQKGGTRGINIEIKKFDIRIQVDFSIFDGAPIFITSIGVMILFYAVLVFSGDFNIVISAGILIGWLVSIGFYLGLQFAERGIIRLVRSLLWISAILFFWSAGSNFTASEEILSSTGISFFALSLAFYPFRVILHSGWKGMLAPGLILIFVCTFCGFVFYWKESLITGHENTWDSAWRVAILVFSGVFESFMSN